MENLRLFVSLPVDPSLTKSIFKQFEGLNLPWEKLKATKFEQLHLTIKFLGETPLEKLPDFIEALQDIDTQIGDIELHIDGPQIFNDKRPQVLTLKIADNEKLKQLYDQIDEGLYEAGLANMEKRKFSAHLTLARVKQTADFEEFKDFKNWHFKASFITSHFELQQSELDKNGPVYTVLQSFDL